MDELTDQIATTRLAVFQSGRIAGEVWKIVSYDKDGDRLSVEYDLELLNGPPVGCVRLSVLEIPDLASVLEQALAFATDADDALRHALGELFTARRGAEGPRT